jgi:hypothetical protein
LFCILPAPPNPRRSSQSNLSITADGGALALRSGHALHRGPHRGYTDVIAARVEQVRATFERQAHSDYCTARRTAVMRLCLIQNTMRRALTDGHRGGFWLNRRDPMRLFVDRPYLDAAIDRMYALVSG